MTFWPGSKTAATPAESFNSPPATDRPTSPVDDRLPAPLILEITRGATRFPRRPVNRPRFLIGAGVTCDLRIGGENIPALHSLISLDEGGPHIEAIAAAPTLLLNGKSCRAARLADGDVVRIGDVELVARLLPSTAPAAVDESRRTAPQAAGAMEPPVTEMSALELIDLIENEEEEIARFDRQREVGARALLQAAQARSLPTGGPRMDAAHSRQIPAPHFLSKRPQVLAARGRDVPVPERDQFLEELEHMGRELTSLSDELRSTAERANEREAMYAEAADVLLEAHQKLAGQLEAVIEQVGAMAPPAIPAKPRAIA